MLKNGRMYPASRNWNQITQTSLLCGDFESAVHNGFLCFGCCRMQADRLSAGQHPHHQQQQSVDQSARSVTTIMFPPVSEHVQSSTGTSTVAAPATTSSSTARDRSATSASSAFLLTKFVHLLIFVYIIISLSLPPVTILPYAQ